MCEKATVGIDLSIEMVKTGLNGTATRNVRLSVNDVHVMPLCCYWHVDDFILLKCIIKASDPA